MEQRIGSSSQPLPGEPVVKGAGFDPAFIPGLTPPASGAPEDTEPEKGKAEADASAEAPEVPERSPAPGDAEGSGDAAGSGKAPDADEPDEAEPAPDGPVFEAADRRARIVADHRGVRLALDDQECEFRWDEIGAVETETARFGKRFTVTVHTHDRRWYPLEIEAASRARFAEWDTALDAVLDAYFEDGAETGDDDAADPAEDPAS